MPAGCDQESGVSLRIQLLGAALKQNSDGGDLGRTNQVCVHDRAPHAAASLLPRQRV
jgi:hypothetical protein